MHLCLFEDDRVPALRPLVETRAVYDLRLGRRTVLETAREAFEPKELVLHSRPLVAPGTRRAHDDAFVNTLPDGMDVLFVNGRFVAAEGPALSQMKHVLNSDSARAFVRNDTLLAAWVPDAAARLPDDVMDQPVLTGTAFADLPTISLADAVLLERPWDLLDTLHPSLVRDADAQSSLPPIQDRSQATVHESTTTVCPEEIHVGRGAQIRPGALLNAEDGPICIGPDAVVHERAVVRGPCSLGPKTEIKIGADVEGVAAGRWCKIGGEVHDSIIHSYSNKSHDGFLGHAYLGSWCNLGAGTNNSNLKNSYGEVSAYAPEDQRFVDTGRQFVGLFMGDHSKCGINTMFNTGTVIGTNCNLFGGDFPPRYLPPFSWGGPSRGFTEYRLDKAQSVAERVMARRDTSFTEADRSLLTALFERTRSERAAHHG